MLIKIGSTPESETAVGLLRACHERIRFFIGMARQLAETDAVSSDDVREAAAHIERYFSQALPLHIEDEEHSVLPRLIGRERSLDLVLEKMQREHQSHDHDVAALLELCRELRDLPARLTHSRQSLQRLTAQLQSEFDDHLREEEAVIFPFVECLPADESARLVAEFRARRA